MGSCKSRALTQVYMVGMEPDRYFDLRIADSHKIMFQSINMTEEQAKQAFHTFIEIDADKSGVLTLTEFCVYFGLTPTKFTDRVFGVSDEDDSGELSFKEFLAGIWNFCSLNPAGLARFAFNLLDTERSGAVSAPEAEAIVRLITGKDSVPPSVRKVLNKTAKQNGGVISVDTWITLAGQHRSLMGTAYTMQERIRSKMFDHSFWTNACVFRARFFKDTDEIVSILVSAIDRETAAMRRIMKEEYKKAADLEDGLIAEIEEEEEERLKAFDEVSSPGVADEARKLSQLRVLEAQAKRALQELLDSEPEPTNDQRLSFAPLVLVVREIEKLLADIPSAAFRALEEKKIRALEENSASMWGNVEQYFKDNKKLLETKTQEKLKEYQDMLKFQGQDAALTVITNEAFQKLKKGNGSITDAAAMQVKLTYFTEQLEDSTSMIHNKYREMQIESKAYYKDLFDSLLSTYCGVDDSMVDYVNIWQRRFDPVNNRFTFYAPKTSVWVSHVPLPGHENQDFEDLKKFHKYGIVM